MYNTYNHRYQKKEYELFDYFLFAGTKCLNACLLFQNSVDFALRFIHVTKVMKNMNLVNCPTG